MATTVQNTSATSNPYDAFNTSRTTNTSDIAQTEDRFLKLLIAQMQNQDPLNPLDNAQVTTQMAQINTVQGIEKLNTTVAKLMATFDANQSMQAAGMIGKNVLVAGSALPLVERQAFAGVLLDGAADNVRIKITDSTGRVVQEQDLGAREAGSFLWSWDGMSDTEQQLADGKYSFSVSATRGGETVKATALQVGTVSAVVRDKTGFTLDLGNARQVAFTDVHQIL